MKVSIVVPVYNVEKYLDRCMKSLLVQTIDEYEIILVDDGSTDGSSQICDTYFNSVPNIKVIHKCNAGLGYARNTGLNIAKGEYIAFVDSDDYVDPKMYKVLYDYAESNVLDAVYCSYDRIKEGKCYSLGTEYEKKIYSNDINQVILGMIGNKPFESKDFAFEMSSCMSIYRREVIENNRIRFFSEREYISEDLLFNIKFLYHATRVGFLGDRFYHYCINGDSLTTVFKQDRYIKDKEMYIKLKNELDNLNIHDTDNVVERFILSRFRIQTKNIVLCKTIGHLDKKSYLDELSNDKLFVNLMNNYPIDKMPFMHRVFYKSLYKRNYFLIGIIYSIKERLK